MSKFFEGFIGGGHDAKAHSGVFQMIGKISIKSGNQENVNESLAFEISRYPMDQRFNPVCRSNLNCRPRNDRLSLMNPFQSRSGSACIGSKNLTPGSSNPSPGSVESFNGG